MKGVKSKRLFATLLCGTLVINSVAPYTNVYATGIEGVVVPQAEEETTSDFIQQEEGTTSDQENINEENTGNSEVNVEEGTVEDNNFEIVDSTATETPINEEESVTEEPNNEEVILQISNRNPETMERVEITEEDFSRLVEDNINLILNINSSYNDIVTSLYESGYFYGILSKLNEEELFKILGKMSEQDYYQFSMLSKYELMYEFSQMKASYNEGTVEDMESLISYVDFYSDFLIRTLDLELSDEEKLEIEQGTFEKVTSYLNESILESVKDFKTYNEFLQTLTDINLNEILTELEIISVDTDKTEDSLVDSFKKFKTYLHSVYGFEESTQEPIQDTEYFEDIIVEEPIPEESIPEKPVIEDEVSNNNSPEEEKDELFGFQEEGYVDTTIIPDTIRTTTVYCTEDPTEDCTNLKEDSISLFATGVKLVTGSNVKYPSFWGTHNTNYFTMDGAIAYCANPQMKNPGDGTYTGSQVKTTTNADVLRVLSFGYQGKNDVTSQYLQSINRAVTNDNRYILTHIAVSVAFGDSNPYYNANSTCKTEVQGFINYIKNRPFDSTNMYAQYISIQGMQSIIRLVNDKTSTVTTNLTIHKRSVSDLSSGDGLKWLTGATFKLYAWDGSAYSKDLGTATANGSGSYTFSNIDVTNTTNFLVKETGAPTGYKTPYFFFDDTDKSDYNTYGGRQFKYANGAFSCYSLRNNSNPDYGFTFLNYPVSKTITVTKLDADTNAKLKGAKFEIWAYRTDTKYDSVKMGNFTDKGDGTYTYQLDNFDYSTLTNDVYHYLIKETQAPSGYNIESVDFPENYPTWKNGKVIYFDKAGNLKSSSSQTTFKNRKNQVTVTFDPNGGTSPSPSNTITKAPGTKLGTLPTTTKTGYTFNGWYTAKTGGTKISSTTTMPSSATTYYAQWSASSYTNTLNYNANGGTGAPSAQTKTVTYPNTQSKFTVSTTKPTKSGYTFAGWYTAASGGSKVGTTYTVGSNNYTGNQSATIYAHWTANTYTNTLNYNANGGTGAPSAQTATVTYPNTQSKFTVSTTKPTKSGYTFAGWYTAASGGTKAGTTHTVGSNNHAGNQSATLYAHWTANTYTNTLNYNANGGSGAPSAQTATVTYPNTQSKFTVSTTKPTKSGYTFAGWYTAASGGTKAGTTYTVGSAKYAGNQSATLYAHWTANTYTNTLNYNANGGTGAPAAQTASVTYPNTQSKFTVSTTKPTRTGYTFAGWYTTATGGTKAGTTFTVGSNNNAGNQSATLYAHWTANTYTNTLSYNANGGSGAPANQTATVTYPNTQSKFTVSTTKPSRTGYTFAGWYTTATGGTKVGSTYTLGSNNYAGNQSATLYAHWTANSYTNTLSYNANGGSGAPSAQTATVTYPNTQSKFTVSTTKPTKSGYTFAGWYTAASGGTKVGTTYTVGSNNYAGNQSATLYAQWTANTYTVVYNSNKPSTASNNVSGTMSNSTHTYDVSKALNKNTYSLKGWRFNGWNRQPNGSGTGYSDGQSVLNLTDVNGGTVTLYAQWVPNTYTVTYNSNKPSTASGSVTGSTANSSHTYDVAKNLTTNGFALTGYTFNGWNSQPNGSGTRYSDGQSVSNLTDVNGGTVTLYAQWTANSYNLAYNLNDTSGSSRASMSTTPPSSAKWDTAFSVVNPTRVGYTFTGWTITNMDSNTHYFGTATSTATSSSGRKETSYKNLRATSGTVTFTAQWTANTNIVYTVNHYTANLDGVNYTLHSTDNKTGTADATVTLADLKKTITGFTYKEGKVNGAVVTTTTILADGSRVINLYYSRNTYTNSISHWAYGFKNSEGNNGDKTAFKLTDTTFTAAYESKYTMDASRKTTLPNGFYLASSFGTSAIEGTWKSYAMGTQVTQKANAMGFQYSYHPTTYTITYDLAGGTIATANPSSYTVLYGVNFSNSPTRKGYIFNGWYDGNTKVTGINVGCNATFTSSSDLYNKLSTRTTGNKTITAKWTPINYTIVYDKNKPSTASSDVVGTTASSSHTYDVAKNLTTNGYSLTGWRFNGWNSKADGSGTPYADKASVVNLTSTHGGTVTLYAQWIQNTYTVTYDKNKPATASSTVQGTTANSSHTYDVARKLTKNGYTLTGWTFTGWNDKADGSGKAYADEAIVSNLTTTHKGTVTLYAQWRANTYTVTYNKNKPATASSTVQGTTANSSHTYDVAKNLTANGYTLTGWTFTGWNDKADGSGKAYADKASVVNLTPTQGATVTLYAQWRANTYTVTYDKNKPATASSTVQGTTANSSHTYDVARKLTKNGYTLTGWTFTGWNDKADGTGKAYSDEASVVNLTPTQGATVTLYAQWRANTYTVKFDGNHSTSGTMADIVLTYDVETVLPKNEYERQRYQYAGWSRVPDADVEFVDEDTVLNLTSTDGDTVILYAVWLSIPEITPYVNYYFENSVVPLSELLKNATVDDDRYGDITSDMIIKDLTYSDSTVVANPTHLDTTKLGAVSVKYSITNDDGITVDAIGLVYVVKEGSDLFGESDPNFARVYSRYISGEMLSDGRNAKETLRTDSVWKTTDYDAILSASINRSSALSGYDFVNDESFISSLG